MTSMLTQALRSRGFGLCIHAGLWLLLLAVLSRLSGKAPAFHESNSFSRPIQQPVPVASLESLFAAHPGAWHALETNTLNPFFTAHFVPASVQPATPPTTLKIPATYLGYYETGMGVKQAVVRLADAIVAPRIGAALVTNWQIAAAGLQSLVLTNSAAQTNLLRLNAQHHLEGPLP